MAISLPNLDDRRWADLVEEGRALLPVIAPGWTDHNVSDPGITLIELFAWLVEQSLYRANRVVVRHRTKFLQLVQELPLPARAARATLCVQLDGAPATGLELPATSEFVSSDGLFYRTLAPLRVSALRLRALQWSIGSSFRALAPSSPDSFAPFGEDPTPGAALYLGFDAALPADETLSLQLCTAEAGPAEAVLARIATERAARHATEPNDSGAIYQHHSAELIWEYRDGSGRWLPLSFQDGTRAFSLDGPVRLVGPSTPAMAVARLGSVIEPYHYVRCRYVGGHFDSVPRLQSVLVHAVAVEQSRAHHGAALAQGIEIGVGSGEPFQRMRLPAAPVLVSSLQVWSPADDGARQPWDAVADLAASSADARHFVFDSMLGELRFGDGRSGHAPAHGETLHATFRATAAEQGMLAARSTLRLADTRHNTLLDLDPALRDADASVAFAAHGGAAAESLGEAAERAASEREAVQRAVTLADYEALALTTPGVALARAHALANHHPSFDCLKAPGHITVIVVPSLPRKAPQPSAGLRAAVKAYLSRRRVLGTRVEVVGPSYLEVAVHARVRVLKGQRPERLQREIGAALDRFLDPLRGGDDGAGWRFGRDVYRSEILQVIDDVPGVDHVLDLTLVPSGCEPACGNVCLKPTWLTTPGLHAIEVV